MSFDVDKGEVREAVENGDVEWLYSALSEAYRERDAALERARKAERPRPKAACPACMCPDIVKEHTCDA